MIIVDKALEKLEAQGKSIGVGLIGHGFIGRGIEMQLAKTPGMRLVAIGGRQDWWEVCRNRKVDAIVDATGDVELGAKVACDAVLNRKHLVLVNAELDATIGPILRTHFEGNDLIYTAADGDQPGVTMNLYRQVKGMGFRPLLCGNIKTFHDRYSTPDTVAPFAGTQKPTMITSFADGTKISIEQSIIANGTGMRVSARGMHGPRVPVGTPITEIIDYFSPSALYCDPGVVDYVVGASPAPGVFVIASNVDTQQRAYLKYYKMGPGPAYVFYTPYHLCHFEVQNSIARAVLFGDATLAPLGKPMVDVVATAKKDLKAGDRLDGIGGYTLYGLCENYEVSRAQDLFPIGLTAGAKVTRDVARDQVLTYDDVSIPHGRICDDIRGDQDDVFGKPDSQ